MVTTGSGESVPDCASAPPTTGCRGRTESVGIEHHRFAGPGRRGLARVKTGRTDQASIAHVLGNDVRPAIENEK